MDAVGDLYVLVCRLNVDLRLRRRRCVIALPRLVSKQTGPRPLSDSDNA